MLKENVKPLRLLSPKLYTYITGLLQDKFNIHSYDLQIHGELKKEGLNIIIHYGETFSDNQSTFFTHREIEELSQKITDFIQKTGEACTEVLIDDYFKIYAP